jgi:hypothetical protein
MWNNQARALGGLVTTSILVDGLGVILPRFHDVVTEKLLVMNEAFQYWDELPELHGGLLSMQSPAILRPLPNILNHHEAHSEFAMKDWWVEMYKDELTSSMNTASIRKNRLESALCDLSSQFCQPNPLQKDILGKHQNGGRAGIRA